MSSKQQWVFGSHVASHGPALLISANFVSAAEGSHAGIALPLEPLDEEELELLEPDLPLEPLEDELELLEPPPELLEAPEEPWAGSFAPPPPPFELVEAPGSVPSPL